MRLTHLRRTLSTVALVAAGACSSSESTLSSPAARPPGAQPDSTVLTRPAKPLNISIALDRTRATTRLIDTTGGTISATAGDGTRYTLTLPRNALVLPERITLIPISATAGHVVAGIGAGVAFEPEGLRLLQPAVLRIQTGSAIPVADQIAIGWHADGRDVHLEPLQLGTSDIVMNIWHFSGVAVGGIYVGDNIRIQSVDWADYTPQEFEDRAQQYIGQLIQGERDAILHGADPDPEFFPKIRTVYDKWFTVAIRPMMLRSVSDCSYAKANWGKLLGVARSAALFGFDDLASEVSTPFVGAVRHCLDDERRRCLQPGDTTRAREILELRRFAALAGASTDDEDTSVPLCPSGWSGNFTTTTQGFAPGTIERVTARVTFTLDASTGATDRYKVGGGTVEWSISGPLGPECTVTGSFTAPATATDGILLITRGTPTTYIGKGGTVFPTEVTVACPTGSSKAPYTAGAVWFMSDESGRALPVQSATHIAGQRSGPNGSATWDLTFVK